MAATKLAARQLPPFKLISIVFADSPYTLTDVLGDVYLLVGSSGGNVTVNLPTAVGNTMRLYVKKTAAANIVTLDGNGSETLDGGLTAVMKVKDAEISLFSDNVNWNIF